MRRWQVPVRIEGWLLLLLRLMPARWAVGWLSGAAMWRLRDQFRTHCGQILNDTVRRLQPGIRAYVQRLDARVEETIRSLEAAVSAAVTARSEGQSTVDAALARLAAQRTVLREAKKRACGLEDAMRPPTLTDTVAPLESVRRESAPGEIVERSFAIGRKGQWHHVRPHNRRE